VLIFRKVSSNFNPAVTLVHMYRKDDSFLLGSGKIVMQFLGAFAAAYLGYYLADITGN
jgi:glycerol uptake facilitator-like aquaporin